MAAMRCHPNSTADPACPASLSRITFFASSALQLNEEEKAVLRGRMEAADKVLDLIKRHEASTEGTLTFEGKLVGLSC